MYIGALPKPIEHACQRTAHTPNQCNNVHSLHLFIWYWIHITQNVQHQFSLSSSFLNEKNWTDTFIDHNSLSDISANTCKKMDERRYRPTLQLFCLGRRSHSQISAAELIHTFTATLLADVKRFKYAGIAALEHLLLFICIFVNSKCGCLRCVCSCLMIVKRLSKHGVWIEC